MGLLRQLFLPDGPFSARYSRGWVVVGTFVLAIYFAGLGIYLGGYSIYLLPGVAIGAIGLFLLWPSFYRMALLIAAGLFALAGGWLVFAQGQPPLAVPSLIGVVATLQAAYYAKHLQNGPRDEERMR
jgi:hypothetical protein